MRVLVSGGTGFIGSALCRALVAGGHDVMVLARRPQAVARSLGGVPVTVLGDLAEIPAGAVIDAIVNLAGEPIAGGRWTTARRRLLHDSRIGTTQALVALAMRLARPPAVFVSGSAIGYYGDTGDVAADEDAAAGQGFAADLCRTWEAAAAPVTTIGTRLCIVRTGIVLDAGGGALQKMLPPFRAGLGGRIGDGRQWMAWIHRADMVALLCWLLANERCRGAYNAVAPEPVRNAGFTAALAAAVHRPALLPVPATALRLALGEAAGLLLDSQRIVSRRLAAEGFVFRYPQLPDALAAAVG